VERQRQPARLHAPHKGSTLRDPRHVQPPLAVSALTATESLALSCALAPSSHPPMPCGTLQSGHVPEPVASPSPSPLEGHFASRVGSTPLISTAPSIRSGSSLSASPWITKPTSASSLQ